ncbi:hypothetical protein AAGS40_21905 [Paraburkholderia sp. PREW-6R]|uniref:hypothetical protein n=1 Tax=Paraburkholderia sp. PREW-6R TaxID=3141544 RepID=UPI0031F59DA3
MAERHATRDATALTHRTYTLRPARPLAYRVIAWAIVCLLSAGAGAAALTAWRLNNGDAPLPCAVAPVDEDAKQTELVRTKLALAQESAARAAVQKTADSANAEVARLNAQLQFLRGQSNAASVRR